MWLGILALLFAWGILTFLIFDSEWNMVSRSTDYLRRTQAELSYWWTYTLPGSEGDFLPRIRMMFAGLSSDTFSSDQRVAAEGEAASIPVLLYHGTPPEGNDNPPLPLSVFREHLYALKEAEWHTVTLDELYKFLKEGAPLPDKSFLLTFDDGRRESFYPTDPILKELGFTAVMFVITGSSLPEQGKPSPFYLTKTELQYMLDTGRWEFGSHTNQGHEWYPVSLATEGASAQETTLGHFLSNKFWIPEEERFETDDEFKERVYNDLLMAKRKLEEQYGKPMLAFAFPFSDFGQNTVNFPGAEDILEEVVPKLHQLAFYQTWEGNGDTYNYPDKDVFFVKRIEPTADWSGEKLLSMLHGGQAKKLPYDEQNFGDAWMGTWGEMSSDKTLTISAAPQTTGGEAMLNGSYLWRNYYFESTLNWTRGSDIILIARHYNNDNYFACAFSNKRVAVQAYENGERNVLASVPFTPASKNDLTVGMAVSGNTATCYGNGEALASASSDNPRLVRGGIGIQIWDARLDVGEIVVKEVHAKAL